MKKITPCLLKLGLKQLEYKTEIFQNIALILFLASRSVWSVYVKWPYFEIFKFHEQGVVFIIDIKV